MFYKWTLYFFKDRELPKGIDKEFKVKDKRKFNIAFLSDGHYGVPVKI